MPRDQRQTGIPQPHRSHEPPGANPDDIEHQIERFGKTVVGEALQHLDQHAISAQCQRHPEAGGAPENTEKPDGQHREYDQMQQLVAIPRSGRQRQRHHGDYESHQQ
jgi:hypothetical protein